MSPVAGALSVHSKNRDAQESAHLFQALVRVTLKHAYYNGSEERCPDLAIVPTAHTIDFMRSRGMLYQREASGFSVLVEGRNEPRFLSYLATQDPCARLAFMLVVTNPSFFNLTDRIGATEVPIDASPRLRTFYASNATAEPTDEGRARLEGAVSLPVTGSQYGVVVKDGRTVKIVVRDACGEVVFCQCVEGCECDGNCKCGPNGGCVDGGPGCIESLCCKGQTRKNATVFLDLLPYPEGRYRAEEWSGGGRRLAGGDHDFVYTNQIPSQTLFLDLLLSPPEPPGGAYPTRKAVGEEPATATPIEYEIEFGNRWTRWRYFVVSTGAALTDLAIESVGGAPATFSGPTTVSLPGGQMASRFVSDGPLPLQQRSTCELRLLGKAGGVRPRGGPLVRRLPVASPGQVFIEPGEANPSRATGRAPVATTENYSDIYVYV